MISISKWKSIFIILFILLYSIPIGLGAYYQLSAHRTIQEITGGVSGTIDPDKEDRLPYYRSLVHRSDQLKLAGRNMLFIIAGLSLLLVLFRKFTFFDFLFSLYGSWLLGAVFTLPWSLGSAIISPVNYYMEQFMIEVYTAPFTIAAFAISLFYNLWKRSKTS